MPSFTAADLRHLIITLAVLYLGAGFLRGQGRPGSTWLRALGEFAADCIGLFCYGGRCFISSSLCSLIANLSAICGVYARRFYRLSASRAGLTVLVPLAALALAVVTTVPGLATRIATRQMSAAAPIFSFKKLDGTVVNSAEFRGVWLFWTTGPLGARPVDGRCQSSRSFTSGTRETRGSASGLLMCRAGRPGKDYGLYAERGLHSADCFRERELQPSTQSGRFPFAGDYRHGRTGASDPYRV